MGAGKTSLMKKISQSKESSLKGFDLDEVVASSMGIESSKLGDWINQNGLESFRKLELSALKKVIAENSEFILALGGGTPSIAEFWDVITGCQLVFLDVDFETCFERIANDSNRPLVSKGKAELLKLYQERVRLYQRADLSLSLSQIKEIDGPESLVHNFLDRK